jgi:uncharacterized lipoprotein YehR (DUF1307 family)
MKKISLFLLLFTSIFVLSGCSNSSTTKTKEETPDIVSNGESVNTSKMSVKHCTRSATAGDGIDVSLNYYIYYTGENINVLYSEEKVISASDESLDTYEEAYKKIESYYEGLDYYDAEVIRGDTTVTSKITINYDKIDIDKLLSIEGEDDNIIENGKAKLSSWITLAEKFGTTCEDA